MARVAGAVTSAAHPARNAGQVSLKLSSDHPGSALHATCAYFAGSEGCGGVEGDACGGVGGAAGLAAGRGAVAQPATITSIAAAQTDRVARERREQAKMLWFFLEALVALLIAVAIVGWTMGFGRRKPREKPGDADRDNSP
jgi:hypothetical protein